MTKKNKKGNFSLFRWTIWASLESFVFLFCFFFYVAELGVGKLTSYQLTDRLLILTKLI